jgi:hypothetical protein
MNRTFDAARFVCLGTDCWIPSNGSGWVCENSKKCRDVNRGCCYNHCFKWLTGC